MPLSIKGYVLEPPRVGQSNSPFTLTPNVYVSDQAAYDVAYPDSEVNPRTEYHVFVLKDGDFPTEASFCWTKNEVINRFDYHGQDQRFRTMPGAPPETIGTLAADSNVNRLKVVVPISSDVASFPIRIAVGDAGSGASWDITLVANDAAFTPPAAGFVQLSLSTGNLNWAAADLTDFLGQIVRFQRQTFFPFTESDGNLGVIEDALVMAPKPATGQFPLIRIGFGEFLTPIEQINEGLLSADPVAGTVEWARNTGLLKFNSGDMAANPGRAVYYEGVCLAFDAQFSSTAVGTVSTPGTVPTTIPEESDLFFRIPGDERFATTARVDTLSTNGKKGQVEVRRSDGQVQFSAADQAAFGAQTVHYTVPDLLLERGLSVRWFRTPVDLEGADDDLKDVSAFYETTGATWSGSILQTPQVFLPAVPVDTRPITVRIEQGTGSFVSNNLPRLDAPSPPGGEGYILDFPTRQFNFARRRLGLVSPYQRPYATIQLADPGVFTSNLVAELENSAGSGAAYPSSTGWTSLVRDVDYRVDLNPGVVTLVDTAGTFISSGTQGSFSGSTMSDTTPSVFDNVMVGDLLIVKSGPAAGVYGIVGLGSIAVATDVSGVTSSNLSWEIRRGQEIIVDRYFQEVPPLDPNTRVERLLSLGTTANSPRLSISTAFLNTSRFRFGKTTFSTSVVLVANPGAFTAPGSMAQGAVEIAQNNGELNFSQVDVTAGLEVFWARTLTIGADYLLQPPLGFVELTDRLLQDEEVVVTYAILDENDNKQVVVERASFAVRKEITQAHPDPTSTLFFNPDNKEVAASPAPKAFRGGRPQTASQVTFNIASFPSSVTFLPSDQITDALPSGSTVNPNERVFIDYFIHEALGGEKSLTVLNQSMVGVTVIIEDGTSSFTMEGNRTATFPANHLLRIDEEEIYLLAAPSYNAGTNTTTINLASPQQFRSDFRNPSLAVTSGQTRPNAVGLIPSYFVTEANAFVSVPRGNSKFRIVGDVSRSYVPGVVVLFDGGSFKDYNFVTGSIYNADTNLTEVVLSANVARQYTSPGTVLKRSVRPILETAAGSASTSRPVHLDLPFTVFRRVEGEVGEVLARPTDYEIDASGRVTFTEPLKPNEALSVLYTGTLLVEDGRAFRASYTHLLAPSASNGIAGQVLKADYTTYVPDTVYFRVETMTNFRGELAEQFSDEATAASPTGGPVLENAGTPQLFEQGRESVFFQEGRLANEDMVARATLKFFNDGVNYLEDAAQHMDGRVVGDHDGRFLFDGEIDNPARTDFADVTNQIDDLMKISDAPVTITMPGFVITSLGTFEPVYKPAKYSRFYSTLRQVGVPVVPPAGLETGDTIADLGFKPITGVNSISHRQQWALVTVAAPSGVLTLTVDTTDEEAFRIRPKFDAAFNHRVVIQDQDGTFLVGPGSELTVFSFTGTSITFTAPVGVAIPVGATIWQVNVDPAPPATPWPKFFRPGFDVGVSLEDGVLTHVTPYPPFDGGLAPPELNIQNPAGGEIPLDVNFSRGSPGTEPYRFSALDGGVLDDDNNRGLPILNPSRDSEDGFNPDGDNIGYLPREKAVVGLGGYLRTNTTDEFIGTGSLNVACTRITLDSGNFPAPVPKVHDLVQILTGVNAGQSYRRITAVGANFVEVAVGDAWATQEAGIDFLVTVSASVESGTGNLNPNTRLTDAAATFITNGVQVGHTLVITNGVHAGRRRQVTAVISETQLNVQGFPSTQAGAVYVVDDPISTFGGTGSVLAGELLTVLDGQLEVLDTNTPPKPWNEREALEEFFDHVFDDVFTGTQGQTSFGGAVFTDLTVDFTAQGINLATDYVHIRNQGTFKLDPAGTITATTLPIEDTFTATASSISYRIVTPESMSKKGLQDVHSVLLGVDETIALVTAFRTLVTTLIPVLGDAGAFATALTAGALEAREADIDTRVADIEDTGTGPAAKLGAVMASGDRLYDRRFVWIDGRINLLKGLLPKKERARENRIKQQEESLKAMTKLLTT